MAEQESKSIWRQPWSILGGIVTAVGSFFSIFELLPRLSSGHSDAWTLHFLPDVLIGCGATIIAVSIARKWGSTWIRSYRYWLTRGRTWQKVTLLAAPVALVVVSIGAKSATSNYYRARLFMAKFDWPYAEAKAYLSIGEYEAAIAAFERQGERFGYMPPDTRTRRDWELQETRRRLADVKNYLARFERTKQQGTFGVGALLLVQRAFQLYPDSAEVLAAAKQASQMLRSRFDLYLSGLERWQNQDCLSAQKLLREPRNGLVRIFDEEVLLRYCRNPAFEAFNDDEKEILNVYLSTPIEELRTILWEHPLVRAIVRLPTEPRTKGARSYREELNEANGRTTYRSIVER